MKRQIGQSVAIAPATIKDAYVVNWRLELEANSNQTETVFPAVFVREKDARAYAFSVLHSIAREWGNPECDSDIADMNASFNRRGGRGFVKGWLYQLTSSDNLVIELTKCKLNKKEWNKT